MDVVFMTRSGTISKLIRPDDNGLCIDCQGRFDVSCGSKAEVKPRSQVRLLLGEERKSVRQVVECFPLNRERESAAVESEGHRGLFVPNEISHNVLSYASVL